MKRPLIVFLALLFLASDGFGVAMAAEFNVSVIDVPIRKSVFGQVRSRDLIPARARIGGTIIEINVEEGDQVEAGQVIARVVDDKIELQLGAVEASLLAVIAHLENATTNLERGQQLFSRGTIAKSRLDELQTQFDVLTSQLRASEASKDVIIEQANEGAVIAPSAGRVLSVPVTKGSVILPGELIARIAGGGYFLRLLLPERHAAGLHMGDEVLVASRGMPPENGNTPSVTGRLVKIYPEIENGRVTADVEVETLGNFFVGERFLVSVPIGSRRVLAIPVEAITVRHGIDYVTIQHGDATIEISVIPGGTVEIENRVLVEILTGLNEGDRVVLP
ncbi:MAG: efflux RND transporter periplasmic adaptor subunit [Rhizobiales bacterium]|nr:efflux RND transporter periplasmic adaptor subunit [Hyphomicrobiales bacterium]